MKGILIEPGKEPVVTTLPDSLWAIENRLGTRSEMIVLPRTPAVLFVGRYDGPIQPRQPAEPGRTGAVSFTDPSSATAGRATTSSP